MDRVLDSCLQRILKQFDVKKSQYEDYVGKIVQEEHDATGKLLQMHWNDCKRCHREETSQGQGPQSVDVETCIQYLEEHVLVERHAVESVIQKIDVGEGCVKQKEFFVLTYLLLSALYEAQEKAFEYGDDIDEDGGAQEKMKVGVQDHEDDDDTWKIKAGIEALHVGEDPVGGVTMSESVEYHHMPALPTEEEISGPLGQGLRDMSFSGSLRRSITHSGENVSMESGDAVSVWKVFDETAVEKSHAMSSPRHDSEWIKKTISNGRSISLKDARKKLIGPVVLGSSLVASTEEDRQRYLDSYQTKGYKARGGMPIRDAIDFYHSYKPYVSFSKVWSLVDPDTHGVIDERGYLVFMTLIENIVKQGDTIKLPASLSEDDTLRLIQGESIMAVKKEFEQKPFRLDTLKDVIAGIEDEGPMECNEYDGLVTPRSYFESDDGQEEESYSDDGCSSVSGSIVSRVGSITGSIKSMSFTLKNLVQKTVSQRYPIGFDDPSMSKIPQLDSRKRATSISFGSTAWLKEVGAGHDILQISLSAAMLGSRRTFDRPHVSLSLRDPLGRLVELPIESHPGIVNPKKGTVLFKDQMFTLQTQLPSIPPGSSIFFEIKHWKNSKKRMSTIGWSFVDVDMIIDFGTLHSKVRAGTVALPLFKKPLDLSRQRATRLNGHHPCLYVKVDGIKNAPGSEQTS